MNALSITIYSKEENERFKETISTSLKKTQVPFKLNLLGSENIYFWGLTSSNRNLDIWKKISIKDYVMFFVNNLVYISKIDYKMRNKDMAYFLWNKCHSYPGSFELLLIFTKIISISSDMDKYQIYRKKNDIRRNSITLVNNIDTRYPNLQNIFNSSLNRLSKKYNNHEVTAVDYKEPPSKTNYFTRRIIRDTIKTIELKKKYGYKCQICDYVIETDNQKYAEVHHIWPLGEGGLDNFDNMLVLCPNHHAEFDLCYTAIDPESETTILNKDFSIKGKIKIHKFHKLNKLNLKYHFTKFKTI